MADTITISLPDGLGEELKTWAEQRSTTVSGFLAFLVQQRLDADRASRERLAAMTAKDRAADPEYDQHRTHLRRRMHAAKEASAAKKAAS